MSGGPFEDIGHTPKPLVGMLDIRVGEGTHEFIPAIAKQEVIRAEPLSQRLGHFSKKLVSGRVPFSVVHDLQAVHVDESDDERMPLPPGPIDLVLQLPQTGAAPQYPGELIDQIVLPGTTLSIERTLGPIELRLLSIQGSLLSVQCSLLSVKLLLVLDVGEAPLERGLIRVQISLLAVKHLLVLFQGLLRFGGLLGAAAPFRSMLPASRKVEHELTRLVLTSLAPHLSLLLPVSSRRRKRIHGTRTLSPVGPHGPAHRL